MAGQTADRQETRPDGCLRFEMLDRSLDAAMLEPVMGGTEYMVQFLVLQVRMGRIALDQVLAKYREAVRENLK